LSFRGVIAQLIPAPYTLRIEEPVLRDRHRSEVVIRLLFAFPGNQPFRLSHDIESTGRLPFVVEQELRRPQLHAYQALSYFSFTVGSSSSGTKNWVWPQEPQI
jgi:hypothetical protein